MPSLLDSRRAQSLPVFRRRLQAALPESSVSFQELRNFTYLTGRLFNIRLLHSLLDNTLNKYHTLQRRCHQLFRLLLQCCIIFGRDDKLYGSEAVS